ncbi:GapR family DNA-binding domain-containing protein [Ancylobacter tetraedralis]|uniref:GapR family DNA-binding domain-containing protein n=1 Tax=Ancylobacter tetraedralis TaxID=217068 RepID=UPI00160620BD
MREAKKQFSKDEAALNAEAKAEGYSPKAINACIRIRAMKPMSTWTEGPPALA